MSLGRRGGERSVSVRHQSHAAVRAAALTAHSLGDTSFTRSRGPCSSIVTHFGGESLRRWRVRRGFAAGQTGQPEEPAPTPRHTDEARLDAHSDSRKRDQGMRQKRKEVAASVPSRISRVPVGVPARRNAVAEVVRGDIWSRISSRAAPSKRERGESERGPSPVRMSAVTRRRAHRAKRCRLADPSPLKTAEDRQRPRVA